MKSCFSAAFLLMSACLTAQTMSNLPTIVVQPFEEIRTSLAGENYAGAVTSMMKTAIGSSLVFQTEGGARLTSYDYPSLRSLSSASEGRRIFLMTGTVLSVNSAM
ncbi:MAG: hypothetical protein Q8M76_17770, partial [Spirochaetaceae bacterium]|nr:hypothetical protein [Spirochaetaceae bacterium]